MPPSFQVLFPTNLALPQITQNPLRSNGIKAGACPATLKLQHSRGSSLMVQGVVKVGCFCQTSGSSLWLGCYESRLKQWHREMKLPLKEQIGKYGDYCINFIFVSFKSLIPTYQERKQVKLMYFSSLYVYNSVTLFWINDTCLCLI